jgi:hypothetical protein
MFEIGNSLREARMRQGLDYNQVELATKIRAKYIRALEEEQFEVLPTGTYIKGFLRSYAEFLGLDGQLYVDEYNSRYVVDAYDDMPQRRPRVRQERGVERRALLLGLAGIAVATALVFVAWKFGGSDTATPPTTVPVKPQVQPAYLSVVGRGKGTYIEVWKRPWVGSFVLNGTFRAGDHENINGARFWVCISRPSRIRLALNGKAVALPAKRNLRVHITPSRTELVGTRRCQS